METENKDWKPEVGGKAWIVWASTFQFCEIRQVVVGKEIRSLGATYFDVSSQMNGGFCETKHIDSIFPTIEKAQESFEVYDLDGKEVVIPRADGFLAENVLGLQMENDLLKKPVTTLAQAQMLLYEHGMILDLSGLSPILIERGGAAIGGKSDQREGGC